MPVHERPAQLRSRHVCASEETSSARCQRFVSLCIRSRAFDLPFFVSSKGPREKARERERERERGL